MIGYGPVNGRKDIRYDQTQCFLDKFLRDLKLSGQTKFWLETCNVHALASAVEAVGGQWRFQLPLGPDGEPIVTQAGLMLLGLYSAYGQAHAPVVSDTLCENEVAVNLAWVAEQFAGVKATIITAKTGAELVRLMDESLARGSANVLSYLTDYKSGHYIAQVWRHPEQHVFECMDSWADNVHCKTRGDHEMYGDGFFAKRCDTGRLRFIEIARK